MALPVYPNIISLLQIQTEFGGSAPIGLNEYYSNGGLVPASTVGFPLGVQTAIPGSGTIGLANFFGASNANTFTEFFTGYPSQYAGNSFAPFSVSGNTINISRQTTLNRINRVIPTNNNTIGFSVEFQLTSLDQDDAASIAWARGAWTLGSPISNYAMYFNPRREAAFDSLRRPEIYINSGAESPAMGSSALAANTWYRLVLNILPGAGASNAKIYNVATSALVSSATFAASYAPMAITGLQWNNDASAGLTSSSVQYRLATVSSLNL